MSADDQRLAHLEERLARVETDLKWIRAGMDELRNTMSEIGQAMAKARGGWLVLTAGVGLVFTILNLLPKWISRFMGE